MTVTADSPYPTDTSALKVVTIDGETDTLAIQFRGDVQDVLDGVVNALLCYGVRGQHESLAEAVQALGRRAEAAEAAGDEADPDEILRGLVEALQEEIAGDAVTIVQTALALRRDLLRRYRLIPLGE